MSKNISETKVILILIFILVIIVKVLIEKAIPPKPPLRNNSLHTVNASETSGDWELLWMRPEIHLAGQPRTTPLVTTDNTLCYEAQFLVCLNIYSGEEKWTGKVDGALNIASDHNQVYARVGITRFVAYDAENGQKVWQQSVRARNISDIIAYDGFVKTNVSVGGQTQVYHVFDAATGTHQDNDDVPTMAYNSFASDGQSVFAQQSHHTTQAYDAQNHTLIWEKAFNNQIIFRPVFNDGHVFVRTNHVVGTAHALDGETGRILWEKEKVISNVAASNSTAFYVTLDGEVMAIDAKTGETRGRLTLDMGEREQLMLDSEELNHFYTVRYFGYYIEAVDDMVFVYFGDTWQLFGFRFLEE